MASQLPPQLPPESDSSGTVNGYRLSALMMCQCKAQSAVLGVPERCRLDPHVLLPAGPESLVPALGQFNVLSTMLGWCIESAQGRAESESESEPEPRN
jgi:hypothetical protein